jgi:hypothetical protein
MYKKMLLEGAVAGHMNHVYDNGEMTFGELKQLLQAAVDGKLRGTEKTDGQNVFLSFDVATQKARAIRNKGHIKAGGLTVEEFDNFFSGHPSQALRYSFVEALQAFEDAVRQLDKDTQFKIFGNKKDNIYFNTEVMNPGLADGEEGDPRSAGTKNVIPYDKKTLLIHEVGHAMFDPNTALAYDDPESKKRVSRGYSTLENSLIGMSTEDPSLFSIETHPRRNLDPAGMRRASDVLSPTIEAIDNVVSDFGLNDSSTIQDLVMVQVKPIIDNFGMTEDRNKAFILRLMGLCRSLEDRNKIIPCGTKDPKTGKRLHLPPITIRELTAGVPQELSDEIRDFDSKFKYQEYTAALSNSLYEFTNAILQDFQSSFIEDNEKAIKDLQDEINSSIEKIRASANEAAKEDLEKQLKKLQDVRNVNTPSEGFVFDFNGTTYKFTGWFAPSNQILGTERYGRFGPIDPSTDKELASQAETEPVTIAILPGSFKPPHKGHLRALEAIEKRADDGKLPEVDKYLVIISSPSAADSSGGLKSSRPLPMSGKVITAEQSKQMWMVMLDKSPIKNKVQLVTGDNGAASPMLITYQFVESEPNPTNLLVAPEGSKVILVVGDKENDAKRFGGMRERVANKRPDIELFPGVVPVAKHDSGYVSFMKDPENQMIRSKMKSNFEDFNASDMRFMMDFAARDPIGLELLEFYLPYPEDALGYMGIMGLNPADEKSSEEDQVEEPEIDNQEDPLQEIIRQEAHAFYEGFKSQRAPKAKKASGKFQRNMKRRLAKAHRTYLDMGRKDLTKHGGAYHLSRNKASSNAFLAEDDIVELSSVGGQGAKVGSIEGVPGNLGAQRKHKKENRDMENKKIKKLRFNIKEALKRFFKTKATEHEEVVAKILEEHQLRVELREIILEQSLLEAEDPVSDISDNTGINTLKDLFKNTNILATLRNVYKTLTTNDDQKNSFRAHILQWTVDTLAPVKLNDTDANTISEQDVGVDITGIEADPEMFLDVPDGSEKENNPERDEEEEKMKPISGKDTTGRNKAERVYPAIEKSVIDYYAELDNPEDQEMFYDYLIANLKLYFDKWDGEMSTSVEEPTNQQYDQAKQAV